MQSGSFLGYSALALSPFPQGHFAFTPFLGVLAGSLGYRKLTNPLPVRAEAGCQCTGSGINELHQVCTTLHVCA